MRVRMMSLARIRVVLVAASVLQLLCIHSAIAGAGLAESLLRQFDESPNLIQIAFSSEEVIDHEIGLGAIQKIRGEWRFKHSERRSGTLISYTWQIAKGYSAAELMAQLLDSVAQVDGATKVFACDGRACGRAVQWANSVFKDRVLYGREDNQQYRVFAIEGEHSSRLIAYGAERTADRQYLHVELLLIEPQ